MGMFMYQLYVTDQVVSYYMELYLFMLKEI